MRVAIVAPFVAAIDDRAGQIGGAQAVLADLASGLAARGHRVTLLAPRGSRVSGAEVVDLGIVADAGAAVGPRGVPASPSQDRAFARVAEWIAAHPELEVVHGHAFDAPAIARLRGPEVLHTLHLPPLDDAVVAAVRATDATLATVSASCRAQWRAAGVSVPEILPNGLAVAGVPEGSGDGGYLAFAGRMSAEKGADTACRVARALGMPLRLAGPRYDAAWFARSVAPLLGADATYEGALDRPALWRLIGGAAATLLPVRWDEPFGMVALESLACGTPVAAYRRGGLTEVVTEGRGGCFAAPDDEPGLADAARDALRLARTACREDAARFDIGRMLDAHEALYARVRRAA